MHIAIPAEQAAGESRVAATPDTVKKYVALGHSVAVETGAGRASAVLDEAYIAAGATVVGDRSALLAAADIVLTVRTLPAADIASLKSGAVLIGMLDPHNNPTLAELASRQVSAFAMELLPRTTRAQSMDVLSSQANIAGYKAVIITFPMLTIMIILGSVWANIAWGRYWSWDPKETAALVTWLIYGAYLHARVVRDWRGSKSAWLLVLGFAAILFTYFGNLFFALIITLVDHSHDKRKRSLLNGRMFAGPGKEFQLMFGTVRRQVMNFLPFLNGILQVLLRQGSLCHLWSAVHRHKQQGRHTADTKQGCQFFLFVYIHLIDVYLSGIFIGQLIHPFREWLLQEIAYALRHAQRFAILHQLVFKPFHLGFAYRHGLVDRLHVSSSLAYRSGRLMQAALLELCIIRQCNEAFRHPCGRRT